MHVHEHAHAHAHTHTHTHTHTHMTTQFNDKIHIFGFVYVLTTILNTMNIHYTSW